MDAQSAIIMDLVPTCESCYFHIRPQLEMNWGLQIRLAKGIQIALFFQGGFLVNHQCGNTSGPTVSIFGVWPKVWPGGQKTEDKNCLCFSPRPISVHNGIHSC